MSMAHGGGNSVIRKNDQGEATGHGEEEGKAEKVRLLTLDAWVCSVTKGRAGDGGNRRRSSVKHSRYFVDFGEMAAFQEARLGELTEGDDAHLPTTAIRSGMLGAPAMARRRCG